MNEQIAAIERGLAEIQGVLDGMNDAPASLPVQTQGVGQQASATPSQSSRAFMSQSDVWAVRETLRQKPEGQLHAMFAMQAAKSQGGIPLQAWLAAGGNPRMAAFDQAYNQEFSPEVKNLLDSSGGSALIRQDLEPIIYEIFIRQFPAFDRFPKEPANGLVHTWQRQTSFGEAQFMGELGTVTDDVSAYERATTNIAILATRRGVSLKNQFAALQSGSGFNPQNLELRGGLLAIAKKMQDTIFGGHSTDSGGTSNNELGAYDANGFTGLRSILNTARVKNVDPATDPTTTGSIRRAVADAVVEILNYGPGMPVLIYANPLEIEEFSQQQESLQRWPGQAQGVTPGVEADGVMTPVGRLPFVPVRGNSIASYTSSQYSNNTVRDLYVLDENMFTLPYLGSEGPTTIEIPMGVGGQLTRLFIFFGMWGLADKAVGLSNKVRVKVA